MRKLIAFVAACAGCVHPDTPAPASSHPAAASATAPPSATPANTSEGSSSHGTIKVLDDLAREDPAAASNCLSCDEKYATRELTDALVQAQATTSRCYNEALRDDPTLSGRVVVQIRVGVDGHVCAADVTRNDLGQSGVAECAAAKFRGLTYPRPNGGCVDVALPLRFVPRSAIQDGGAEP